MLIGTGLSSLDWSSLLEVIKVPGIIDLSTYPLEHRTCIVSDKPSALVLLELKHFQLDFDFNS